LVNPAEKGWCSIYGFTSDNKVGGAVFFGWYNVYFFPGQALILLTQCFSWNLQFNSVKVQREKWCQCGCLMLQLPGKIGEINLLLLRFPQIRPGVCVSYLYMRERDIVIFCPGVVVSCEWIATSI
jgi:hypothetical protein